MTTFLRQVEEIRSHPVLLELSEVRRHARVLAVASERRNMDVRGVMVLIVGNRARKASTLERDLLKRGCDLCFATSRKAALGLLRRHRFDLVLSEFMLADGTAHQLIAPLRGTETTMFFSNPVEDGCWWTTAVFKGQDRSDEPGMCPAEFGVRLHEVLHDKLSLSSNNPSGSLTDRRTDVPSGFGDQTAVADRSHARA